MTEEDWINLAIINFVASTEKFEKLLAIRDGMNLNTTPDSLIS